MDRPQDSIQDPQSDDLKVVSSETVSLEEPAKSIKKPIFQKLIPFKSKKALPEHAGKKKWYKRRWVQILLGLILIIILVLGYISYIGYRTYQKSEGIMTHGREVAAAIESRDLALAKSELESASIALDNTKSQYNKLSFFRYIPFFGNYVKDGDQVFQAGEHGIQAGSLVLAALEPYADVLGFSGSDTKLEFETAEERIVFLAETVEKLSPQMDSISAELVIVSDALNMINPKRYPQSISDIPVRDKIITLQNTIKDSSYSLTQFQPFINLLPDLLGNPEPRRYMILFQNDAELRPTGGFMTAYATMDILKGKITAGVSNDIYSLDSGFTQKVPAPDPIRKYLPLVYNWNLRDMNLSPDFKISMETFARYYQTVPGAPEVDAIIAIDTSVPVELLKILGPIGVPGYGGEFSAEPDSRCDGNCPQVIYELENIITRPTYEIREGRKSILGPLMNSMLANMMGSPKAKWAEFFSVFTKSVEQKHLLMYFFDESKQEAVEALGAAGRIVDYEGDYLHINDANFAGAKSNLFVEQEIEQEVQISQDGSLTKKLTLTYKNPMYASNCNLEAGQLCLNGLLRDWIRVYVPKGSKIVAARGFEVDMITSEDLGKTVFEGFFTLAPESVKKLELEYTVPAGTVLTNDYKILIQKQPGTKEIKHTMTISGKKPMVTILNSDQELSYPR